MNQGTAMLQPGLLKKTTNHTNQNPSFYLYCEFVLVESKKWNLELYNIHSSKKG